MFDIEKEREAFEHRFQHLDLDFVDDIGYCESETQYAWAAWCAATKRAEEKLEGCVVVPEKANKTMLHAGYEAHDRFFTNGEVQDVWVAMLEAARGGKHD